MTTIINGNIALIGATALLLTACQKPEPADDGFGIASAAPSAGPAFAAPTEVSANVSASALPQVAIIPEAFRGNWDEDEESCQTGDKNPLRITEGGLDYWEDSSTSRSIEILSPTHIKIQTDDYGEATSDLKPGESTLKGHTTWDLTLLDGGKTLKDLTRPGQTILRIRCPAPQGQ